VKSVDEPILSEKEDYYHSPLPQDQIVQRDARCETPAKYFLSPLKYYSTKLALQYTYTKDICKRN
jgi:hypothetical protein